MKNIQQVPLYPPCDIIIRWLLPASGEVCQTREGKLDTVIAEFSENRALLTAAAKGRCATTPAVQPRIGSFGSVFADLVGLVQGFISVGQACAAGKLSLAEADRLQHVAREN